MGLSLERMGFWNTCDKPFLPAAAVELAPHSVASATAVGWRCTPSHGGQAIFFQSLLWPNITPCYVNFNVCSTTPKVLCHIWLQPIDSSPFAPARVSLIGFLGKSRVTRLQLLVVWSSMALGRSWWIFVWSLGWLISW